MSSSSSSMLPNGLPPQAPAPPQRLAPAFVASNLKFGKVGDGNQGAVAFLFSDSNGAEYPPLILTNELGVLGPGLAEVFSKLMNELSPEEPKAPVVHCADCGVRIFGDLAERGRCRTCDSGDSDG